MLELFTDLEQQHKQAELDKKAFEDLVRERDLLSKVESVQAAILHCM